MKILCCAHRLFSSDLREKPRTFSAGRDSASASADHVLAPPVKLLSLVGENTRSHRHGLVACSAAS